MTDNGMRLPDDTPADGARAAPRGYITVASGQRPYLEFAVDLALSLREHNPEPIALLLGNELRPFASDAHLAVFDHVLSLPPGYPEALGKLASPAATPFERTLFVDADCLAIGSLADTWRSLEPAAVAVQGEFLAPDDDRRHHRISTAALARRFGVGRYLFNNSGLLYFRKREGVAVAEACLRLRRAAFGEGMLSSDILLGVVGQAMGVSTIPLPKPMAGKPERVRPGDASCKLVHFIGPLALDTLTWLLRDMRRRRSAAGLPWAESTMMWVAKLRGRVRRTSDIVIRRDFYCAAEPGRQGAEPAASGWTVPPPGANVPAGLTEVAMPSIAAADPHPRRRVPVLDSAMSHAETGQGMPVVFLHGNPTSSYLWRNVIPHVAPLARCLAPDLIGMGASGKNPAGSYSFADHARYLDAWFDAVLPRERLVLVVHDWGGALGFHWARRHPGRVRGIAYMETIVAPIASWDDWPENARNIFQAMRTPAGEKIILEKNVFVEGILPGAILRKLAPEEHDAYRAPFRAPGEGRRPTLTWPRQIPIAGEPADVAAVAAAYSDWLARAPVPKLFVNADPGSILVGRQREACRRWPNQTEVTVTGAHFIQEDSPHEIGAAVAAFVRGLPD